MDKEKLVEAFSSFLDNNFNGTKKEATAVEVHKAVDDEQRKALFIVLAPDEVDLHGDIYSAEEITKACDSFNRHCNQANIQHLIQTEEAEIVESYIAPVDFNLDDGRTVTKGSWLQTWFLPETEAGEVLWKGIKDGTFTGLSIGCQAMVEEL